MRPCKQTAAMGAPDQVAMQHGLAQPSHLDVGCSQHLGQQGCSHQSGMLQTEKVGGGQAMHIAHLKHPSATPLSHLLLARC
jgi:hypothetical protein